MTSPSEPRTPPLYHAGPGSALSPVVATGVLLAGVASVVAAGAIGQSLHLSLLTGLVVGELLLLAFPLGAIRRLGLRGTALGLRRAPLALIAAAVLIGTTTWYLNVRLLELLPFREGPTHTLDKLVEQPPLPVALLAIALAPAICEEVLFRGAVQRAFATRLYPAAAVVLTSVLFAGYHMSLIQLIPTFTLALLLGALALRADSVVPSMIAHFLNNALAILMTRRQPAALADVIDAHPNAALATCAIATLAGISLIVKAPA